MPIAAAVLDFYDDSTHALMAKVAMPTALARTSINLLTPEQHAELPDNDFGLIVLTKHAAVLRKFPVNDPGNAWLSAQYFAQTHDKLAWPARFVAAHFIKSACDAYGVPSSSMVEGYAARSTESEHNTFVEGSETGWMLQKLAQQELVKQASTAVEINAMTEMPNEHFALVVRDGDGTVIRKYAMPDGDHVKLASAYFDKYVMDLAPEHRHRFAAAVLGRAEELNVDLPEDTLLHKWASTEWNTNIDAHLEQRKSLLPRNDRARQVLDKLAASLAETTPEDAALALQTIDRATGLDRYYDRGVTDPYASTMGLGKHGTAWSADIDGATITEADLRKEATSKKIASYFGEAFARQFAQNPSEIFESLPAPEKTVISQIVSGAA